MTLKEAEAIEELKCDNEHCFDQCEGACSSIKNYKCNCKDAIIERMIDELLQYRKIGTVEECKEAVKKQTPKNSKIIHKSGAIHYSCPSCGLNLMEIKNNIQFGHIPMYCEYCGQAIKEED